MALIASSNDLSRTWLVSFARIKVGEDMVMKSCKSLEEAAPESSQTCGATLLMMARRAGYMASSLPFPDVIRV